MAVKSKTTSYNNTLLTVIVLIGLILGVYMSLHQTAFFSHAAADFTPQDVTVSNLSDNSFTVSWVTSAPAVGYVAYGMDASMSAQPDDRDSGSRVERYTHHVTLKDLTPETVYQYKIGSGDSTFDNSGNPYSQKTASTLPNTPDLPQTVVGQVKFKDGSIPQEGIIYLAAPGTTMLTTTIDNGGNWLITINNARSQDLSKYVELSNKDTFDVLAQTGGYGHLLQSFNFKDSDNPYIITLDTPASPTPKPSSLIDIVRANYGKRGANLNGDLNHDGVVNALDLILAVKGK